jgi:hypothetical protein
MPQTRHKQKINWFGVHQLDKVATGRNRRSAGYKIGPELGVTAISKELEQIRSDEEQEDATDLREQNEQVSNTSFFCLFTGVSPVFEPL